MIYYMMIIIQCIIMYNDTIMNISFFSCELYAFATLQGFLCWIIV